MTKLSAARYRTTNWPSYNAALKKRGSLLIRCPLLGHASMPCPPLGHASMPCQATGNGQHMPAWVRGWLDKEMTWLALHDGRPGRPAVFSDAAIHLSGIRKQSGGLFSRRMA